MTNKAILFVMCISIAYVSASSNPAFSRASFKKLFESAKPYADLSAAFYSVKGLELLDENLQAQALVDICNFVKSKLDKNSLESIYFATSLVAKIPNCALPVADFKAALDKGAASTNVADLYYYAFASQNVKQPIDAKKLSKSLLDGLKADSSILNQAYSLQIATLLPENQKTFFDNIEDLLDQADEVDKKFLQYEGGVGVTSLVLEGIFNLATAVKQFPAKLDQPRLAKFVNYLLSKRHPTNVRSSYFVLRAVLKLTDNQFNVPVVLDRLSQVSLSASQPNLLVSLTNILGEPVKQTQFDVEVESAKNQKANGAPLTQSKKKFTSKSSDGTTFEVTLFDQQSSSGFYTVVVTASPKDKTVKRFFLLQNSVEVKVTTLATIVDLQLGIADRDQSAPKLTKLEENKQLSNKLEADQQSKFYLRFGLKDKSKNSFIEAHQAFVRFQEKKSGREIVFLAQPANNQYSAEVDFTTNAKNFRYNSGIYTIELVVADSLIDNPIVWKLADVDVKFIQEGTKSTGVDKASLYAKRPEIKHTFRAPEPTPSPLVSTVFAALCLAPLGLLFLLWLSIGFNFSRFSFSLSGAVFHLSLAAIFGLYYCYWIKLDMFQTLKYLAIIGAVSLVSGSTLLRNLAANKQKTN